MESELLTPLTGTSVFLGATTSFWCFRSNPTSFERSCETSNLLAPQSCLSPSGKLFDGCMYSLPCHECGLATTDARGNEITPTVSVCLSAFVHRFHSALAACELFCRRRGGGRRRRLMFYCSTTVGECESAVAATERQREGGYVQF